MKTSELFGFKEIAADKIFGKTQCYDGVSSSVQKGNAQKTSFYISKNTKAKPKREEETRASYFNDIAQNLFISVGILMVATVFIMKCLKRNEEDDEEDD